VEHPRTRRRRIKPKGNWGENWEGAAQEVNVEIKPGESKER
jgi:hypothetical protein